MKTRTRDDIDVELETIKAMVDAALERPRLPAGTKADLLRIRDCAVRASMALALVGTRYEPEAMKF